MFDSTTKNVRVMPSDMIPRLITVSDFTRANLSKKNTFADRVLSEEPKFVRKRRSKAISESVSTLEKENR